MTLNDLERHNDCRRALSLRQLTFLYTRSQHQVDFIENFRIDLLQNYTVYFLGEILVNKCSGDGVSPHRKPKTCKGDCSLPSRLPGLCVSAGMRRASVEQHKLQWPNVTTIVHLLHTALV